MAGLVLFAWAVHTWNEHAAIDRLDRAGQRLVKGGGDRRDVRPDDRPVDRGHNQHGKRAAFKPLLFVHVLVAGQKNVETLPHDQRQQRAVFDSAPSHTDHGMNLMPGQGPRQLGGYVLIEQNLQSCA